MPAMIVHVDESPVGSGKTERAIRQVVGVPARWLIAVEKIDGVAELAARIRKIARGTITLNEIASTGPRRGSSVRQEVEAMPFRYESGHVVVICTHAALLMSDLREFEGWHLIVDEVPNVLLMSEVQSKLDATFFETHYALAHVHGPWSEVTLTEAGKRIDGSDLQQDDSHRHLCMFHQRVADSERTARPVVCNLRCWGDMRQSDLQWTWWSLFSVRQLAAFATVRFLGNGFMNSVSAKMMQRWEPDVQWVTRSTPGDRPLVIRSVLVRYFSPDRRASKNLFESPKGQTALTAIAAYIAADAPSDRFIWSSNDVVRRLLARHLPAERRLAPRQAGTDSWMHCTHAAMIYAAKPSKNVKSVLRAVSVTEDEWISTNEREAILQFVTRTSIRDVASADRATVYVFDKDQADYLMAFFAQQPHMRAASEFVDLGLDLAFDKPGPKAKARSPEEVANTMAERRKRKAQCERDRRARQKVTN